MVKRSPLSPDDAARLLATALRVWEAQGVASIMDEAGRSWLVQVVREPALGLLLQVQGAGRLEFQIIGQATLGADELRASAILGALAALAARVQTSAGVAA